MEKIDMSESLADRMQLCKDRYNDIPQCLIDEVRALVAENAEYEYTPQAYDEMWERVKKTVNENDELKAEIAGLRKEVQRQETLKGWARVDADEAEKECNELKAQLEKSINNKETDSN